MDAVSLKMKERGSWQEVLRALCAVEAVVSQGSSAACGEIAVHFQVGLTSCVCNTPAQMHHASQSCHPISWSH